LPEALHFDKFSTSDGLRTSTRGEEGKPVPLLSSLIITTHLLSLDSSASLS